MKKGKETKEEGGEAENVHFEENFSCSFRLPGAKGVRRGRGR